mgnify:FL=1
MVVHHTGDAIVPLCPRRRQSLCAMVLDPRLRVDDGRSVNSSPLAGFQ